MKMYLAIGTLCGCIGGAAGHYVTKHYVTVQFEDKARVEKSKEFFKYVPQKDSGNARFAFETR